MSTRMYVCESSEHSSTLLSLLNDQRLKGVLCDAAVQVQGHIFKAHVNILASSMGYFRDLYISSGKEKPHDVVEIPIIVNSTGFAKILDFVYTSQLCLSQSTVMQVLCSACYLQIPYVVQKCQEFITTHGHVTSPASLSEVAAPFLQGLQQNGFPKLSGNQSASASLSFLSQLNRMSEKSRIRLALQQQAQLKQRSSPHNLQQEGDNHQECTLINTPPSPADRSPIGGDRISPANQDQKETSQLPLALPFKRDGDSAPHDEKRTYSPHYKYPSSIPAPDNESITNNMAITWQQDPQPGRDFIDHKSLADYFSTPDCDRVVSGVISAFTSYPLNGQKENSDLKSSNQSKSIGTERSFDNSLSTVQKKERPRKEYGCDYCGKMFGRQQHLKRHILTHTGERPYPCQYCEKRFRRSEHLKHHLANHEQAMGLEPSAKKKKTRKAARADDAYSMSKRMLGQYGNLGSKPQLSKADSDAPPSVPVVLPSMYMNPDQELLSSIGVNPGGPGGSPSAPATDLTESIAPSSDHNDNHQGSPSYLEQSPMVALNLCRDSVKDDSAVSPAQTGSVVSDDNDRNFDGRKSAQNDQLSSGSRSPNDGVESFDENPAHADIIGMESSEVVTTDLKRLIAAFNN